MVHSMLRSALLPLGPGSRSARAEEALAALARDTRVLPFVRSRVPDERASRDLKPGNGNGYGCWPYGPLTILNFCTRRPQSVSAT